MKVFKSLIRLTYQSARAYTNLRYIFKKYFGLPTGTSTSPLYCITNSIRRFSCTFTYIYILESPFKQYGILLCTSSVLSSAAASVCQNLYFRSGVDALFFHTLALSNEGKSSHERLLGILSKYIKLI